MLLDRMLHFIDRQSWLDTVGERLQKVVKNAFSALGDRQQEVEDTLYGVGLGHPLHTIVNDIPIGMWSAALALDTLHMLTGQDEFSACADVSITLGLAGAAGAVATGLADWQHLKGHPRRVGTAHALLNDSAAVLYALSLKHRLKGQRAIGWGTSLLGFGTMIAAAYLGGHMVYEQRVGVDHAAHEQQALPSDFTPVLNEGELSEGELRQITVGDVPVLLVKRNGTIHALVETCSHLGGPLADGHLEDGSVVCPWHASRFDLEDGTVLDGPSVHDQPTLDVRIHEGKIEVRQAHA